MVKSPSEPIVLGNEKSHVHSVAYDAPSQTLQVRYKSKSGPSVPYRHDGVPAEKWDALKAAESLGVAINAHIKPNHPATKLDPEKDAVWA